jgi:hypothetical protein
MTLRFRSAVPDGLEPSPALAAYLAWRKFDWSTSPEWGIASWKELTADNSALKLREVSVAPVILNSAKQAVADPGHSAQEGGRFPIPIIT